MESSFRDRSDSPSHTRASSVPAIASREALFLAIRDSEPPLLQVFPHHERSRLSVSTARARRGLRETAPHSPIQTNTVLGVCMSWLRFSTFICRPDLFIVAGTASWSMQISSWALHELTTCVCLSRTGTVMSVHFFRLVVLAVRELARSEARNDSHTSAGHCGFCSSRQLWRRTLDLRETCQVFHVAANTGHHSI